MGSAEAEAADEGFRKKGEGARDRGEDPRVGGKAPRDDCCAEATAAERPIAASAELKTIVGRRKPRLLAWLTPARRDKGRARGYAFPCSTDDVPTGLLKTDSE